MKKMNKMNALRHYLSKAKKALKAKRYDTDLVSNIESELDDAFCNDCIHEDFGYCALRNSNMTDEEAFMNFCLPNMIKAIQSMIKEV